MTPPIFLFSAGWRSGSTLLQRMITASGKVLMWGEAGGALNSLADAFERYAQMLGPGSQRFAHGPGGNGAQQYAQFAATGKAGVHQWVACLNPPAETFANAFREWMHAVYAQPAAALGYAGWGVKEVQSGLDTAHFLRLLYPDARFVFLVRHPLDCLLSIKRRNWMGHHGGHDPVEYYAGHWRRLAQEFRQTDFGFRLRYEDLLSQPAVVTALSEYLGVELAPEFPKASRADWPAENDRPLTFFERRKLLALLRGEMQAYGYV